SATFDELGDVNAAAMVRKQELAQHMVDLVPRICPDVTKLLLYGMLLLPKDAIVKAKIEVGRQEEIQERPRERLVTRNPIIAGAVSSRGVVVRCHLRQDLRGRALRRVSTRGEGGIHVLQEMKRLVPRWIVWWLLVDASSNNDLHFDKV